MARPFSKIKIAPVIRPKEFRTQQKKDQVSLVTMVFANFESKTQKWYEQGAKSKMKPHVAGAELQRVLDSPIYCEPVLGQIFSVVELFWWVKKPLVENLDHVDQASDMGNDAISCA